MDDYYSYGLDSHRELSTLSLDYLKGHIKPKEVLDLVKGRPCGDEFFVLHPELKDFAEPPDDDTSPST
ncbi:hypothetical protein ACH4TV_06990 [Streptomyces sp. NPDC020898]|uniref:hypothetical protein n=1 Tax=Streptomyces sp. NPDC020898 TaxID=3365101 RepID=UPI0037ABBD2E